MSSGDSSTTRPLLLRKRPDLVIQPIWYGTRRYWVVKDPLSLRYYQLRDEEHAILEMLDGQTSSEEIQTQFRRRFAPQHISPEQLQAFLGMLHREGLILANSPGQGEELRQRAAQQRRQAVWRALASPLAIRFRGFDPQRFLAWIYPEFRWLFSPGFLALAVLFALAALLLCAVQFETLVARLPNFHEFFTLRNALLLAVVVAGVKILHEIGHGLACHHFGGKCHELGFMLLVFMPCLYCNVSDAWTFPSKWRRIAVSAAGMYVEILIAATATFVWWLSQPGLLNSICLDIMFVCSVSTVLFNGNPLLRYDGYYILADLVEVPNLRQQAGGIVRQWLARWFAGVDLAQERMLPQRGRGPLAAYLLASVAYRWFVMMLVLWVLHKALEPYRLQELVAVLTVAVVAGIVAAPLWRAGRFLHNPLRSRKVKWLRLLVRGGLAAALIGGLFFVPLPHRVSAPVWVQAAGAQSVYISEPGTLQGAAKPGDEVQAGAVLAQLHNTELAVEVEKLTGQAATQRRRVESLSSRQLTGDKEAEAELPSAKEALADLETRLRQRRTDLERLTVKAGVAGTVLPPPRKPPPAAAGRETQLVAWSGTPLDERNRGSFLERGTLLCQVGDPHRLEAVLVIDQADIDYVRKGQRVRIQLDQLAQEFLEGTISEVSELDLDVVPRELLAERDLPMRTDASGVRRPLSTSYQARVTLDEHDHPLRLWALGVAKIDAPPEPLAWRIYRYLRRTLRIEL
jgi:putative peptide zinc metalloprotease protein